MNPTVLAALIAAAVSLVVASLVGWWFTRRRESRLRRITHEQSEIEDRVLAAFYGRVRDLRAETQNLHGVALEIMEGKSKFADNETIFSTNRVQIEKRIADIRVMLTEEPTLYDWYGDQVVRLENAWQRASLNLPSPQDTEQVPRKITSVIKGLEEIVLCGGILTIPNRVQQHLAQQRVGNALDFHEYFNDELPKLEDRLLILNYMHSHPTTVNGVIALEEGLIYHVSPTPSRRFFSFGMVLVLAAAGFGAVWFFCQMFACDQAGGLKSLLRAYSFTLVGAIAHVLVEFLKRDRASKANASGLHDWYLHLHVKELSFFKAAISLWVGFLLLAYFVDKPIESGTAFLLGYSTDSVLDLFLQRFMKKISAGTQALQQQLQPGRPGETPKS